MYQNSFKGSVKTYKVVILDENQFRRDYLKMTTMKSGHIPFCFEKSTICLDNLIALSPDLIVLGHPSLRKMYRVINTLMMMMKVLPILVLSSEPNIRKFIRTHGFNDVVFIKHDFVASDIDQAIQRTNGIADSHNNTCDLPPIIGNTPEMVVIKKKIEELSQTDERMIIFGERGSGRELAAKAIHYCTRKDDSFFVKVKPETFQHFSSTLNNIFDRKNIKKAILGADSELLDISTGTVFIGDIDQIPLVHQNLLFHVLHLFSSEHNCNSSTSAKYRIRFIASARSQLDDLVDSGLFRRDLYHRLNVINLTIPPLRDRKKDIPFLLDYFVDKYCLKNNKTFFMLSEPTENFLTNFFWPGNVEELKTFIGKLILNGNEENMIKEYREQHKTSIHHQNSFTVENIYTLAELSDIKQYLKDLNGLSLKNVCQEFISRAERKLIEKALKMTKGNRKKASILLDISYKTFLNKIKSYNLNESIR